jgi:hypothetical protein
MGVMEMKRLICVFLILSFIATLASAQTRYGQPQEEETIESLKQELQIARYNAEKRNPDHAVFWSIIPGGGQVYNGQYIKAVVAYGAVLFSALAAWGNAAYAGLTIAVWTYTAYDAHRTAVEYNEGLKKKYGLSSLQLVTSTSKS